VSSGWIVSILMIAKEAALLWVSGAGVSETWTCDGERMERMRGIIFS